LERGNPLLLNELESPPPRMIYTSLVKIGPMVMEKKRFLNDSIPFLHFMIISP
jgi:hypothetical protein